MLNSSPSILFPEPRDRLLWGAPQLGRQVMHTPLLSDTRNVRMDEPGALSSVCTLVQCLDERVLLSLPSSKSILHSESHLKCRVL